MVADRDPRPVRAELPPTVAVGQLGDQFPGLRVVDSDGRVARVAAGHHPPSVRADGGVPDIPLRFGGFRPGWVAEVEDVGPEVRSGVRLDEYPPFRAHPGPEAVSTGRDEFLGRADPNPPAVRGGDRPPL